MRSESPRISFGIIVLNGEPFTRYALRALYPFAHEIIVVEGAVLAAAGNATDDGHSTDGTLDFLRRFKAEEDHEDKVQIVVRTGFWSEKDRQSQAYAERATGDYLWQVDIDEFYQPDDMQTILNALHEHPDVAAVSFKMLTFWGGLDYLADGWYLRRGANIYHRLFKWGQGYKYVTHRPPTVLDEYGRDIRSLKWTTGSTLAGREILLYHYSLLFPKQVLEKSCYYGRAQWAHSANARLWAEQSYLRLKNPFRVHNVYRYPSWLERFGGCHPPQIVKLLHDIETGKLPAQLRGTQDIERLLSSPWYRIGRNIVLRLDPVDRWGRQQVRGVCAWLARLRSWL